MAEATLQSIRAERFRLELEAVSLIADAKHPCESEIAHSIAISLKRIADAVAGDERNSGIVHALFDLIARPAA